MPFILKRGRFGKNEIKIMTESAGKVPPEDIAKQINRDVVTVKAWIRENLALDLANDGEAVPLIEKEIRNQLRTTPEWQELKEQFLDSELKLFEYEYGKFMAQFKNDVLPTEEVQIFLLIKLDILMNRNLKQRQRAVVDIERMDREVDDLYRKYAGKKTYEWNQPAQDRLANLENQLVSAKTAQSNMTGEYLKLSEKHSAIMKELKGTRDQRISKIENSKMSFLGLLKELQDEETRKREGDDIELMRAATDKERERLSISHKYVDDTIDQPLLTPNTVGIGDDDDEE